METRNSIEVLSNRVKKLHNGYLIVDGYKELIHNKDEQSLMSEHDKFVV